MFRPVHRAVDARPSKGNAVCSLLGRSLTISISLLGKEESPVITV